MSLVSHANPSLGTSVRTRFAPSPTGFVHLGNIRSALYPWAFARHHAGTFILRIEDTDLERSSEAATQVILDSLTWLGMDVDEGPIYQTHNLNRYQTVIDALLANGLAYRCYMSSEALDALREQQLSNKQKPKYDNTWRPEPGKTLPPIPENVSPVIRFKTPLTGAVQWQDAVKGSIQIQNTELDDFIIARDAGMPTYNFCVVVDDLDMRITHVIRGDDHVNNTPKQIHLMEALLSLPGFYEASTSTPGIPIYAHLPTVLNEQGEKMSKRHGAVGVLDYAKSGYLPQAVMNYLARLGWSHGDEEVFSAQQFIEWFDLNHLGTSAAQHNPEKLNWLNAHYIKTLDFSALLPHLKPFLKTLLLPKLFANVKDAADFDVQMTEFFENPAQIEHLKACVTAFQQRSNTLVQLVEQCCYIYQTPTAFDTATLQTLKDTPALQAILNDLCAFMQNASDWQPASIQQEIKRLLTLHQLKMPALGMPLRFMLANTPHTPSLDVLLYLIGAGEANLRIQRYLQAL